MDNSKMKQRQEKASHTLAIMLDYLCLDANLKTEKNGDNIVVKIASEDAGRIIGRKGQTLENLQLLLNRMLFNKDKDFPRVMLDIDGYNRQSSPRRQGGGPGGNKRRPRGGNGERGGRENNKERLTQQALDASKEVKRWGESVTLPAMNSHDRRIIHITLQEDAELETYSEGEGNFKKVIISLKK